MSVLANEYKEEILPQLVEKFNYNNVMEAPKLEKIVVNVGLGDAKEDTKLLDTVVDEIARITGQSPTVTRAKKSIANFKIREGMPVGVKVTLRGEQMFEFLYKLINVSMPRIRDFRGVSPKSFDGRGNYSLGINEHTVFPEINIDDVDDVHGMEITIVTSAETDEEAFELLSLMGMPYKK
ncbi:MAG: large subunit ribosomal protein L5 [Halanaerobium sp. 4-GBenrich]|jgi:large subunit ribosomal protein L5|uniref:Large ribosomal subunit protein uL5 n=1 Tax=Halanaerobium congolense TaxID=54121 RepID=A0A1G6Q484_9FIRM|nr:50S ribosomal protein L5 [Halanaerobium congolense]KXS46858.1 MAG: large subunit ribosomal protein L5 [Halanaerobium sp. T82-1]ODS50788.1 MAG: large subunit ribosomal protein L5 [Halanaerobium sp. 4-GBenrich]PUU89703.1 MAG: large subunit ribosomal protein L5 [Halanaerobium sp.]PTX15548.1 LSU ribosomal protein L5P [Halanaerobium congolense]PXV63909.1 LSU ribosomal protein L5P [Halanaerobium congolense]